MYKTFVLSIIFIFITAVRATAITFTENLIDELDNAFCVQTVDIDDDGDLDVVAGSRFGAYWYENDGDQEFTAHELYDGESSGTLPTSTATATWM